MSTQVGKVSRGDEIEHHDLQDFLCGLEDDPCLFHAEQLQERLVVLDRLDAEFGGFGSEAFANRTSSRIHGHANRRRSCRSRLVATLRTGATNERRPRRARTSVKSSIIGLNFDLDAASAISPRLPHMGHK